MKDLRRYTIEEFAQTINEDTTTIQTLMNDNRHLGYTNTPYNNVVKAVNNSTVKDTNKEIVAQFIYTNLFNRPIHRFYNGRGKGIELR